VLEAVGGLVQDVVNITVAVENFSSYLKKVTRTQERLVIIEGKKGTAEKKVSMYQFSLAKQVDKNYTINTTRILFFVQHFLCEEDLSSDLFGNDGADLMELKKRGIFQFLVINNVEDLSMMEGLVNNILEQDFLEDAYCIILDPTKIKGIPKD
jgi:hypothetical protein